MHGSKSANQVVFSSEPTATTAKCGWLRIFCMLTHESSRLTASAVLQSSVYAIFSGISTEGTSSWPVHTRAILSVDFPENQMADDGWCSMMAAFMVLSLFTVLFVTKIQLFVQYFEHMPKTLSATQTKSSTVLNFQAIPYTGAFIVLFRKYTANWHGIPLFHYDAAHSHYTTINLD